MPDYPRCIPFFVCFNFLYVRVILAFLTSRPRQRWLSHTELSRSIAGELETRLNAGGNDSVFQGAGWPGSGGCEAGMSCVYTGSGFPHGSAKSIWIQPTTVRSNYSSWESPLMLGSPLAIQSAQRHVWKRRKTVRLDVSWPACMHVCFWSRSTVWRAVRHFISIYRSN